MRVQEFQEQVLQEKIPSIEKEVIDNKIMQLEKDIHSLYIRFLNHVHIVEVAINRELIVDFNLINRLNIEHIEVMKEYNYIQLQFDFLQKMHPDYDFESVIDFSEMERQKFKLNKVIEDFNLRFSTVTKIQPLYTVQDCKMQAKAQAVDAYNRLIN